MTRQKAAGKPFFLYLPVSRTHFPNLPSKRFEGASRIGQFGDSLMEGDAIVGKMLDSLKELGLENDTIVVFASDNGPDGPGAQDFGMDMPDMGLQDLIAERWAKSAKARYVRLRLSVGRARSTPGSSYAMFSIMDFFPTFAALTGAKVPDDRPIDGSDQSELLLGKNAAEIAINS